MASEDTWQDDDLTTEEYAANGLSRSEGESLWRWVYQRLGLIVSGTGLVGSGVFVRCPNGAGAFLTARHVLVPALRQGDLSVVSFVERQGYSSRAKAIRLSTTCDAGLVVMGEDCRAPLHLAYDEWSADRHESVSANMRAVSAGLPGLWKGSVDPERRVIDAPKILMFFAGVVAIDEEKHEIRLYASRGERGLPQSLKGISGGPLFTLQRRLLGLNRAQSPHAKDGELIVAARSAWTDLIHSPVATNVYSDFTTEERSVQLTLQPSLSVQVDARFFVSASNPNCDWGRIERIVFNKGDAVREIAVSSERVFSFPSDATPRDRMDAFQDETTLLLDYLGIPSIGSQSSLR